MRAKQSHSPEAVRQGGDWLLPWTDTEVSMIPCMAKRTSGTSFRASELSAKVTGAMGGQNPSM
jgi:hypothetical protein